MFDVDSKDLFKAPVPYALVNGTDVYVSKVKIALPIPWLEVVCGRNSEEEIYLLGDDRMYEMFAETPAAQKIRSIAGRVLDRRTGKLKSIVLNRVVALADGISIRFRTEEGELLNPLTMVRDLKGELQAEKILFQVNKTRCQKSREWCQQDSGK